jgi:predicted O-linked N-acetylglucosamine transferase (SPINDLY family)
MNFLLREAFLLQSIGRHEEACAAFDRVLALRPNEAGIWYSRADALLSLNRFGEALASYDRALQVRSWTPPPQLWFNRGLAFFAVQRFAEALYDFDRAAGLDPEDREVHMHRAAALNCLGRYRDALAAIERFLESVPDHADALVTKGLSLFSLGSVAEALACYDRALATNPDCIEARVNRGGVLGDLKRFQEAAADYDRALARKPNLPYLAGIAAQYRRQCCDWARFAQDRARFASDLAAGEPIVPFVHLAFSQAPEEQLAVARAYAAREHPPVTPLWRGERYGHDRIRIAYVSADFRAHPMAHLMTGVFEHHDKTRFETVALSFGPDDASPLRRRAEAVFDRFIDVRNESASDIARRIKDMEVDIAVDLMGYTTGCRPGIFAHRAAPVQAGYLGYAATMGAAFIDYLLADRVVIPDSDRRFYAERIAYLPDSYLPGVTAFNAVKQRPSRAAVGLPERGFVFASFNNSFKFTPEMFDIWMRLLRRIDGSVLWLTEPVPAAMRNLKREAEARGVAAERIVFAPYLEKPEDHLARLALADLFLDTLPYNAHSGACDALWAGVPVLTSLGATFAGRVAASALSAAGLPELIAPSLERYESLALDLAANADALAALKSRLERNRATQSFFDTKRIARHIEAAYATMRERAERGLPPEDFAIPASTGAL